MMAVMALNFLKMHGLGNDFVIIDGRDNPVRLAAEQIRHMGDRRRGIGFDQLILLENGGGGDKNGDNGDNGSRDGSDGNVVNIGNIGNKGHDGHGDHGHGGHGRGDPALFMTIYNPDGSEAGACGNATRCVASLIMDESGSAACTIRTVAGLLYCTRAEKGRICVDMGAPRLEWDEIPLAEQCDTLSLPLEGSPVAVSMGNPHCVYFCGNAEDIAVDSLGPKVEHNPLFPERTNVEYVSMQGDNHLRMRVWERGAGITQACGTGACAAAVAAIRRGLADRALPVCVTLDGGDLFIEWRESDDHVLMTGPASFVYKGSIE
ncbi:MAG: diaminopimelate epimerase [Micavibrio sp.]